MTDCAEERNVWLGYKNYQLQSFVQWTWQNYIKLIPQARAAFLAVPQSDLLLFLQTVFPIFYSFLLLHPEAAPRLRAVALTRGKQILECPNQTGYVDEQLYWNFRWMFLIWNKTEKGRQKDFYLYSFFIIFFFLLSFYYFISLKLTPFQLLIRNSFEVWRGCHI